MSFFYNINPLTSTNQDTTDIMYGRIACPAAKVSISGNRNKSAESDTGFTGYLYRGKPDAIEQKRALAQKRAWKIVNDTYASEREMDTNLQERLAHAKGLRQEKAAAQREIMRIDQQKEALREQYGVKKDSKEQKDAEAVQWINESDYSRPSVDALLDAYKIKEEGSYTEYQKRALAAENPEEREKLRQEHLKEKGLRDGDCDPEQTQLETLLWLRDHEDEAPSAGSLKNAMQLISDGGYTEYQTRFLELESYKEPYKWTIMVCDQGYKDQAGIHEDYAVVRSTELERLKKDPMLEAEQQADEILASASKDIIGMLVEEAKDHIEEEQEEEQEKAEENREEEQEEQEKIEEVQERREELEEMLYPEEAEKKHDRPESSEVSGTDILTESMLKMETLHNDIKQEIGEIVQKMNLIEEDMKGVRVDEIL